MAQLERHTPATLAALEELRRVMARRIEAAHVSELEDADERNKQHCAALDAYFDIRSHEIAATHLPGSIFDTPAAATAWETWEADGLLCFRYRAEGNGVT